MHDDHRSHVRGKGESERRGRQGTGRPRRPKTPEPSERSRNGRDRKPDQAPTDDPHVSDVDRDPEAVRRIRAGQLWSTLNGESRRQSSAFDRWMKKIPELPEVGPRWKTQFRTAALFDTEIAGERLCARLPVTLRVPSAPHPPETRAPLYWGYCECGRKNVLTLPPSCWIANCAEHHAYLTMWEILAFVAQAPRAATDLIRQGRRYCAPTDDPPMVLFSEEGSGFVVGELDLSRAHEANHFPSRLILPGM